MATTTKPRIRSDRHRALASARSKAKERLARAHPQEFRKLYDEEVKKTGIKRYFVLLPEEAQK
jgi:hypothetical protein